MREGATDFKLPPIERGSTENTFDSGNKFRSSILIHSAKLSGFYRFTDIFEQDFGIDSASNWKKNFMRRLSIMEISGFKTPPV